MSYWWVSQNQTYEFEVPDGYMWAPKTDKAGNVPQSYMNMLLLKRGDIVFSFAGQKIKAVGVVLEPAKSSPKPKVFSKAEHIWNEDGWRVEVLFHEPANQIFPKNHMGLLAPLLPPVHSPLRADGQGNQVYLCAISDEFGSTLLALNNAEIPEIPAWELNQIRYDELEQDIIASTMLNETEKATLVMARRGQGIFREHVQILEKTCRVTKVSAEKFLIASHIKPWKLSDNQERLSGNNGLFLSPHVDKLFDRGFISFKKNGSMLVSPSLDPEVLPKWKIDPTENFGKFNNEQAYFLEHHNDNTFIAS